MIVTDVRAFAAERSSQQDEAIDQLTPVVEAALEQFGQAGWQNGIVDEAVQLWESTLEGGEADPSQFAANLSDSLEQTGVPSSPPDPSQVQRIASWVAVYAINDATETTAQTALEQGESVVQRWVTMQDADVRQSHQDVDGDTVPVGDTFNVAGFEVPYPGAPVGPPEIWINCRCVLAVVEGDEMTSQTFAVDDGLEVTEEVTEQEMLDADWGAEMDQIPVHGILIDKSEETGDNRHLAGEFSVLSVHDGPVPLRWVKADVGQHDGAIRVGSITSTWEEGDRILWNGHLMDTPEAMEALNLLAEGRMGISVDLDSAVFDMDEDGDNPMMRVREGRVRAATLVDIPALVGAWAQLGSWEDSLMLAASGCLPCQEQNRTYRDFAISESEWDGSSSRFTDEEWCRSTIVHLEDGCTAKSDHKMPIREPNGDLSRAAVHNAAARFNQVDAPPEALASARRALVRAYGELDEEPPESLTASGSDTFQNGNIPEITKDAPGWITNPSDTSRLRRYWTEGPGAARIGWGTPGDFNRCRTNLAKYVQRPDWLAGLCANMHYDALGVWPGQHTARVAAEYAFTASAFRVVDDSSNTIPAEWFNDPGLPFVTPITITDDGRVFGHAAVWGVCHTGLGVSVGDGGLCQEAPRSPSNYAYFRTGVISTDEGDIPVGNLTMNTGHAADGWSASRTVAHYDNTSTVVADVAAGEDEFGIWVSGAMRSGLTEDDLRAFKGSTLSGDWRMIGGHYEMVAALAVNVPGFPIPRMSIAASAGRQTSLVAAGVVDPSLREQLPDVKTLADKVEDELERRAKARSLKARFRASERARLMESI